MGGFANQLFEYAMYLKLQEDYPGETIYIDLSTYKEKCLHGGFKLDKFVDFTYFDGNVDDSFNKITEENFASTNIQKDSNYYFDGYWQDECFFPDDLSLIKNIFHQDKLQQKNREYLDEILSKESVFIHVRRGDYEHDMCLGNVATHCFYQNAIDYVNEHISKPHFFVFSDDIEWCQDRLRFGESQVTFITGNEKDVELDIALMGNCKHCIISNSSFSWWGYYLGKRENSLVIMPSYWFNQKNEVSELTIRDAIKLANTPVYASEIDNPLFTIIVDMSNAGCYIRRCLSSILNQSLDSLQVILTNCSETIRETYIQEYLERDKRVAIGNASGAKGQYIINVNANGFLDLEACKILNNSIQDNPGKIIDYSVMIKPGNVLYTNGFRFKKAVDNVLLDEAMPVINNSCYLKGASSHGIIEDVLYYYVICVNENQNDKRIVDRVIKASTDYSLLGKIKRKLKKLKGNN